MKHFYTLLLAMLISGFSPCILQAQERAVAPVPGPDPLAQSDMKKWTPADGILCVPEYSTGCSMGDGFTDFAVEEIENYGSGCADLNGTGWSQYLELGPAILFPGFTHDFIMQTGYNDQEVTIWIDFNDDYDLTPDEIILPDFDMADAGVLYTVPVTIPTDATPGLHYMRARTNWLGSSGDPCQQYTYGEAEDYFVLIGTAEAGAVEGYVTELDGGDPVENAEITLEGLINYTTTSGSDGYYLIDFVFTGDYELTCYKQGYNVESTVVTIENEVTLTQDFELTQPAIFVDPLTVSKTLPVGGTDEEEGIVENSGNGPLYWSASIQLSGKDSKAFLDLQFQYPVAQAGGEAGIESDGFYIYTTQWNGNDIFQYEPDGTFIGSFTIPGVSGLRDLAYDGLYFYGSAAIPQVWEMDFEAHELVSSFTAPTSVRAIAYNDNEDVFYANNYSTDVIKFDKAGNELASFPIGPEGENYYGFAYDAATVGGPFLWGYAQTGESMNEIIQMQLPSGTETGFALDVKTKLSGPVFNTAGGLFSHPNLVFGKWTLGGLVQNEWIWGLELADAQTWLWIEPNAGTLGPGTTQDLSVHFDAADLEPGDYQAEIYFTTYPEVGNPVIEVSLTVSESMYYPCELEAAINCTDVELTWQVCPAGGPDADSFHVYREDVLVGLALVPEFTDELVDPETTNDYKVTAFFDGAETSPSGNLEVLVPLPGGLEPENLSMVISGDEIQLVFDPPQGCLTPDSYNLYRDGELIANSSQGPFTVTWGNYEYYVTAVYYFGESGPSNAIIITEISENKTGEVQLYPNPAHDLLMITAEMKIDQVSLLNSTGTEMIRQDLKSKQGSLDLHELEPGIYFLKLFMGTEVSVRKIIVE